ncbi:hypothetical protein ACUXAV_003030 [Cupriavidus metallidurans]|jgi:hypothetical protein|uniref:Uncharacterized protein n=1 Tax=Cupriavidus metallidurans (strain ATCC 43123 / DSM 2839 / NBRC 102507 / CH34) TaxID=266264 RepID=Q1LGI7_CUPMC|nr:hypothetical protein [Cupriavidus metallidurans]ABF10739.1 conserved hypothetical protein [Cupriavidus metallidurans CH34]AVA35060.1 hypothetical protein C3Z06_16565 [Cupriavidus metallidurans]KWW34204.1 hypothetical protein AU374_04431 [Cupriavidus metallidurans]MDE4921353.1 hypothetical protein [Cupriavidus metallidurans]QGS31796.1 hypothetical protein FOB83_23180 [Cupriavidus metallidurans]
MNHPAPNKPRHTFRRQPRIATWLAAAAVLALPGVAFSQQTASPPDGGDNDAAMRNIQSNFARMTPAPRTIDTINQELKQTATKSHGGGGGGLGQRGGGRHGRQAQQQDKSDSGNGNTSGTAGTPGGGTAPSESTGLSSGPSAQ